MPAILLLVAGCTTGSTAAPGATPTVTSTAALTASSVPRAETVGDDVHLPLQQSATAALQQTFPETDFSITNIDLTELFGGGPGRDGGVPSLQAPTFESQEALDWLFAREPVIAVEIDGEARAYPIQILIWHEIVTDRLGGVPITVTFCPLCNTAIVFDRRVDDEERRFGVSGLLRGNDLVMYDYTNQSLWQQITGEAIVGVDTGKRLEFIPAQIISWEQFQASYPDALVLSRNTGFDRDYGVNPYRGYDRIDSGTLFSLGGEDSRLGVKERVLTVEIAGDTVAFPFRALAERLTLRATVGSTEIVAFWQPGAASALDSSRIANGADVGAAAAYISVLDGRVLTFEARDGRIMDSQTGSVWNVVGEAVDGELAGQRLPAVVSANHFWFAWSIFKPETRIIRE